MPTLKLYQHGRLLLPRPSPPDYTTYWEDAFAGSPSLLPMLALPGWPLLQLVRLTTAPAWRAQRALYMQKPRLRKIPPPWRNYIPVPWLLR